MGLIKGFKTWISDVRRLWKVLGFNGSLDELEYEKANTPPPMVHYLGGFKDFVYLPDKDQRGKITFNEQGLYFERLGDKDFRFTIKYEEITAFNISFDRQVERFKYVAPPDMLGALIFKNKPVMAFANRPVVEQVEKTDRVFIHVRLDDGQVVTFCYSVIFGGSSKLDKWYRIFKTQLGRVIMSAPDTIEGFSESEIEDIPAEGRELYNKNIELARDQIPQSLKEYLRIYMRVHGALKDVSPAAVAKAVDIFVSLNSVKY